MMKESKIELRGECTTTDKDLATKLMFELQSKFDEGYFDMSEDGTTFKFNFKS